MPAVRRSRFSWRSALLPLALAATATLAQAQTHITTPKEQFGHDIGDDYWLANYDQLVGYWHKLDAESDRMQVVEIGKSAEGRPQLMAIISSPENMKHLDRYKAISAKLARAEGLSDQEAHALAEEGKAVVWIDGGLHATEVLGAHQLMETVYQLVSRNDDETKRILDDCIVLAVQVNPDGMQLVSNWYMKDADTLKRAMNIPRLYQKYVGHDDNRDFYMSNMPETRNENHVMYWEWYPQIVYNHHQTGPAGAVMFAPPFRDPFNFNFDPRIVADIDLVGAAMQDRFIGEGKPGVTNRSGSTYSTWWNGGLRTTPYFHNMVGLLTETIGNPTPQRIPFVPAMSLPHGDLPYPVEPQAWHFRQSIDYSVTANYAVLDLAARRKDEFLYGIYEMGRSSIERGSRDNWTASPSVIAAAQKAIADARAQQAGEARARGAAATAGAVGNPVEPFGAGADTKYFDEILRDPARRDARAYVIPADQPDFLTATKFVNALRWNGIDVLRATAPFTVNGKRYPANSYVVKTAQAFRPHVLDMFEPQDHPNDFAYPGGPPKRPYDNAGYTLAFQMGVKFDRVLTAVDGPFVKIDSLATPPAGTVTAADAPAFLLGHATNDAFVAVNRLLAADVPVYWLDQPLTTGGKTYAAGTFYIQANGKARDVVRAAAAQLGLSFDGVRSGVPSAAHRLTKPRIALWDQYGGSMPSGWTRWLLEQYEFAPFDVVYPQQLDAGNLRAKYDVLVLVDGAIPAEGRMRFGREPNPDEIPAEWRHALGHITTQKTLPQLRAFLEQGGTIVTIGSSTQLATQLGLPLENAMVERSPTTGVRPLPADKYYVPGSVLSVAVDTSDGDAAGLASHVDVFFDNSPVFKLAPNAALEGVRPIAWFDSETPLRSGWAWGQGYLDGGVTIAEAKVGKGKLYLFGPEILFRAQPHGTFKFFFNSLYRGGE